MVTEQGFDDSVDTLGRWMAHHIAELIHEAESATEVERLTKQKAVREAILALWTHRHTFASGRNPFEGMKPIFEALESLAPDAIRFRYFSPSRAPNDSDEESEGVKTCVEMAKLVDQAAREIVSFYLAEAAKEALDSSKQWVQLASDARLDDGDDITLIRIIAQRSDLMNASSTNVNRRRMLNDRKQKLEALLFGGAKLLDNIDAQISELPEVGDEGQDGFDCLDI